MAAEEKTSAKEKPRTLSRIWAPGTEEANGATGYIGSMILSGRFSFGEREHVGKVLMTRG
jgi:hypothetical protein